MNVIVYFNSLAPAGGIERVISSHIKFFINKSHNVTLITKDGLESYYPIPSTVKKKSLSVKLDYDMKNRFKRFFQIFINLAKTIKNFRSIYKKSNVDVVYVVHPLCLFEVFFSGVKLKNIFITEHASYEAYNFIYKFIINRLYGKVGLLTVPTKLDSSIYSTMGIKNYYLPNPLPFYPSNYSKLSNKTALNIGRLVDDKRHDLLIRIWAKSRAKELGWKLKIIGVGENYKDIVKLIKKLGLEDDILLSNITTQIEKEYLDSSLFLLTSINEGFGLVLAESMTCGVPCISFNCPSGPRDIIRDSFNGYLIDEGSIDLYINRLNKLMEFESLRIKFGRNAKIDILKFEEKKISEQFSNLISNSFRK
jgi:glycosyltransferase involved in cell wall biosynthesis